MAAPTAEQLRLRMQFDDAEQQFEASTLGMWAFLATEVLFFGGLFTGYALYRYGEFWSFKEGSRHLDDVLGGINTGVLLTSSLTMALAVHATQVGRRKHIVAWLLATMLLGAVFLGIKGYEYWHKYEEGLVPGEAYTMVPILRHEHDRDGAPPAFVGTVIEAGDRRIMLHTPAEDFVFTIPNDAKVTLDGRPVELERIAIGDYAAVGTEPGDGDVRAVDVSARSRRTQLFFSFYFLMTGMHALHMVIGIALVAIIAVLAWLDRVSPRYSTPVEITGLYWHFVDIVWIFLYPLLYLIS